MRQRQIAATFFCIALATGDMFGDRADTAADASLHVEALTSAGSTHERLMHAANLRKKIRRLYGKGRPDRSPSEVEEEHLLTCVSGLVDFAESFGDGTIVQQRVGNDKRDDPLIPEYSKARRSALSSSKVEKPKVVSYTILRQHEDIRNIELLSALSDADREIVKPLFLQVCNRLDFEGWKDSETAVRALTRFELSTADQSTTIKSWLSNGFRGQSALRSLSWLPGSENHHDGIATAMLITPSARAVPAGLVQSLKPSPELVKNMVERGAQALMKYRRLPSPTLIDVSAGDLGFVIGALQVPSAYRHTLPDSVVSSMKSVFEADDSAYSLLALGVLALDKDRERFKTNLLGSLPTKAIEWSSLPDRYGSGVPDVSERKKELRLCIPDLIYYAFCPTGDLAEDPILADKMRFHLRWTEEEGITKADWIRRGSQRIRVLQQFPAFRLNETSAFSMAWRTEEFDGQIMKDNPRGRWFIHRPSSLLGNPAFPEPFVPDKEVYGEVLFGGRCLVFPVSRRHLT